MSEAARVELCKAIARMVLDWLSEMVAALVGVFLICAATFGEVHHHAMRDDVARLLLAVMGGLLIWRGLRHGN